MTKNRERRLPLPPTDIITVLVCTAAVFFVLAFGGKALEGYRLQRHNAMLRTQSAALEEEQQQLQARLEYVQKPEYVEKVAREQYKWAKIGEKLIITIFRRRPAVEAAPTSLPSTGEVPATQASSHWTAWWKLLIGQFD